MPETQTAEPLSDVDLMVKSIGTAGTRDYVPPEREKTDKASTEVKPAEVKPADEGKPAPAEPATGDKPAEQVAEETKAEPTGEEKPAESQDEISAEEILGLATAQAESVETLREQYRASSREAIRLVEERKQLVKILQDELGVEPVFTKNGPKIKVSAKALEKAASELNPSVLEEVWDKMPDEDKELLDRGAFLKGAKFVAQQVKARQPEVPAEVEGSVLPTDTVKQVMNDLASEKISNGSKARLPELLDGEVQTTMISMYSNPKYSDFNSWMNRSTENFKVGVELLYGQAMRVILPKRMLKHNAEKEKKTREEQNKGLPSTTKTGTASPEPKGQTSAVDQLVKDIASARPR